MHDIATLWFQQSLGRNYANHAEATKDVTDYIVGFYNNVRLHSKLGYLPPTIYERTMAAKQPIEVSEIT